MNVLGIDHGSKRVGLAVGSTDSGVAAPLVVLSRSGKSVLIEDIKAIIINEAIDQVVVGLPLAEDGGDTHQADIARAFAARLEEATGLPIILEDERLSSREIESHMNAMGGKKAWKESGLDRDSAAATLFLQTYLDKLKTE